MSTETILEPLYRRLTAFAETKPLEYGAHPRSKPASDILLGIDEFIKSLLERCHFIRSKVPQMELELSSILSDVLDTANLFRIAVEAFTINPNDNSKSIEVERSVTALLSSLSRLLILLGIADSSLIGDLVQEVRMCVHRIATATSSKAIITESDAFSIRSNQLLNLLGKKSMEVLNTDFQEQFSKARYILKRNGRLLSASARVCLEHPDHLGAQNAKEYSVKSLLDALSLIESMLEDNQRPATIRLRVSGKLLDDIEDFENSVLINSSQPENKRIRQILEQHLNGLLPSVYRLADAQQTHLNDKNAVHTQCNKLQQALADLIALYNRDPRNRSALNSSIEQLLSNASRLKQLLGRIAVDHATQTLMNKDQPLMVLKDATKFGNEQRMDSAAQQFQDHTAAMVASAYEVCALTTNEEVCKSTQLACTQMEQLCPQVVGSAYLLYRYPHSRLVEENFDAFCQAYQNAADLLLRSTNELMSVHDVLAVSDDRMKADCQDSMNALANRDEDRVHNISTRMERRSLYACDVVTQELESHSKNRDYVNKVMEKVTVVRDECTQTFNEVSRDTLSFLAANQTPDEVRFRKAANRLCAAVHDMRLAMLSESGRSIDLELLQQQTSPSTTSEEIFDSLPDIRGRPIIDSTPSKILSPDGSSDSLLPSALDRMSIAQENQLPERAELFAMMTGPEKETMAQEFAGFLEEKKRFMREIVKWDDSANEIVVLAKKMCVIIMDMTDYTRGRGPLRTTMDVIDAARNVSNLGQQLDKLCCEVAQKCPHSTSRQDLLAYLQRVTLYCHQLNITSRVKAGVQAGRAEVVENATALIQAARNLMTSVVLTIKQSYIASTKYRGPDRQPVIHWRMRAPPKKQLIYSPVERSENDEFDVGSNDRHAALSELSLYEQNNTS